MSKPFYIIGHNPNTPEDVEKMLANGANALEPDIIFIPFSDEKFYVLHSHDGYLEIQAQTSAVTLQQFNDMFRPVALRNYVAFLEKGLDATLRARLCMLVFDCKDHNFDLNEMLNIVRSGLPTLMPKLQIIVSVSAFTMRDLFIDVKLNNNEALCIDEDNFPGGSDLFFREHDIPCYCYANGISFYNRGIEPGTGVYKSVSTALAMKAMGNSFKMVYAWTMNTSSSMAQYLDLGVDGLITDDPNQLKNLIIEKYKGIYDIATQRTEQICQRVATDASYVLTVKTSNVSGAGTDGDLKFALGGVNAVLQRTLTATNRPGMFESASINDVVLSGPDVGTVKMLCLNLASGSDTWKVDRIVMSSTVTPVAPQTFPCEFNFERGSSVLAAPVCAPPRFPVPPLDLYYLYIRTGIVGYAGTDDAIGFSLSGSNGGFADVFSSSNFEEFESDSIMMVKLFTRDLGALSSLQIQKGGTDDWFCEWIKVRKQGSQQMTFFDVRKTFTQASNALLVKPSYEFKLEVKTADRYLAGTDTNVLFTFHGTTGDISVKVDSDPGDIFERDNFYECRVAGKDIGTLTSLEVGIDTQGGDEDWFIDYIHITDMVTKAIYRFKIMDEIAGGTTRIFAPDA